MYDPSNILAWLEEKVEGMRRSRMKTLASIVSGAMRMQGSAQQKAAAEGTDALQTGHKYLYTAGRTNDLFGKAPGEIINTCVRKEDGSIQIFPIFN